MKLTFDQMKSVLFGAVRTEVGIVPQILDNSYVVACSDFFYDTNWENNIHPYIKHLQADRLANMTLSVGYDVEGYDINYTSGPVLKDVNYVDDNTVEINFNYVADGLRSFDESGDEIIFGLDILVNGQWIEFLDAVITLSVTMRTDLLDTLSCATAIRTDTLLLHDAKRRTRLSDDSA